MRCFQSAQRRRVEVDFRIAFVGCDHESVPVGQFKQFLPLRKRHDRAGRIGGRAGVKQFRFRPDMFRHAVVVAGEVQRRVGIDEIRCRTAEQGRAFVDLVERIGTDHDAVFRRVEYGLRQREQGFA